MATSSINAGKTLCELSGWRISNLRLQKLLYIAHMYHLGRTDKNLVNENFEAWQHGPVEPNLYHYVKGYGADSIGNVFPRNGGVKKDDHEFDVLNGT